mmetsp:Transcript_3327/g.9787  ORF Transcript_3327/g.9787 Transcript_3327/m.9787 type:complete len:208 (-) Transcript_3327:590-1213(-)|eukprot:CAMPEP_0202040576 /NCGR_PEP_ID=MMETSP0962-20130828/21216_1 /ASSEMBLY_ACC=CAM_ASM_000488 /TAXON_ID=4773 /ORGANISM="Schizochytrium aggregatum, Strain ATCC28209" /LENGTH=207 /DNA_ID=CAMNT_0048604853 /DNA_START=13 /DNA_END=636 /DNA_ORIENTATION=+
MAPGKKTSARDPPAEAAPTPSVPRRGRGVFKLAAAEGVVVYDGEWEERPAPAAANGSAEAASASHEESTGERAQGAKVMHGRGRLVFGDGVRVFEGEFRDGAMLVGRFDFGSDQVYEGEFSGGRFHGRGTFKSADGAVYEGGWESNRMHGFGTLTLPDDNTKWSGRFENGQLVAGHGQTISFKTDPMDLPVTLRHLAETPAETEPVQ